MEFGAFLLCRHNSISSGYQTIDGISRFATKLRVGKYIFQRPDNDKMIIEIEDKLYEQKQELLYPVNEENATYFIELIHNHYEEQIQTKRKELDELVNLLDIEQKKEVELKENIQMIEEKNKIEFSENRAKNINGLSKALRRQQGRMKGLDEKIKEVNRRINDKEKEKIFSIKHAEKTIRKYLQEGH